VYSSMRLGVPFIAPRQLGAVECIPGRQFLPSVAWRTGQSGAPHTVRCEPPSLFGEADRWSLEPLAHRTLSGAHRTVRCPLPTVGSATCLTRIASRPLVRPSGGRRTKIQGGPKRSHESHDFLVRQVRRLQGTSHIVATSEI
jgi:hypothetical protein